MTAKVAQTVLRQVAFSDSIAHVIHQVGRDAQLPEAFQRNVQLLQKLNPGWEVRVHHEQSSLDYIREHYGEELARIYLSIDARYGAARADLFRYLVIYNEGGCYLDLKSSMTRPLDEVLRPEDRYLLSQWRNGPGERYEGWGFVKDVAHIPGGEWQQWHVIAAAGHPILRGVILQVIDNILAYRPEVSGVGAWGVWRLGGPVTYSHVVEKLRHEHPCRVVDAESDLGLVYNIFHKPGRVDESNRDGHHQAFNKTHYSRLTHPIIRLDLGRRARWQLHLLRKKVRSLLG